ncbi:hypothetical protein ACUXV3_06865 [Roseobacteraceae bacterium NS-SX3]
MKYDVTSQAARGKSPPPENLPAPATELSRGCVVDFAKQDQKTTMRRENKLMKIADYARIGALSGALVLGFLLQGGDWHQAAGTEQPVAGHEPALPAAAVNAATLPGGLTHPGAAGGTAA